MTSRCRQPYKYSLECRQVDRRGKAPCSQVTELTAAVTIIVLGLPACCRAMSAAKLSASSSRRSARTLQPVHLSARAAQLAKPRE